MAGAGAASGQESHRIELPNKVARGDVYFQATSWEKDRSVYRLRGAAYIETDSLALRADEIDYDESTERAEARGNVHLQHIGGEQLWAEKAEYDLGEDTGLFIKVRGSAPVNPDRRPGLLHSANPYYFEGAWAEQQKDRYVVYDGFITDCEMPAAWWKLRSPKFEVIPNERATAKHAVFWLKGIPIFYAPFFRKSLERYPRRSGFLTPNMGNSSRRGKMVGAGYYWAINRSYDASYRSQYFTQRGFAHTVDFRGRPTETSDFDAYLYGVNDRGELVKSEIVTATGEKQTVEKRVPQGGFLFAFKGSAGLADNWYARAEINYLSSMTFRRAFTETFTEAVQSEVHSVASLSKDWSTYNLDFAFSRVQAFQFEGFTEDQSVSIRKLPEVRLMSRDRRVLRDVPLWISWESSAALLRRSQPLFQTRQLMDRVDLYPRVMTAFRWKDINIIPSFAVRETRWGSSRDESGQILGRDVNRFGKEFTVAIVPPSLARTYDGPGWMGDKVKHVIEPRLSFRHVSGIGSAFDDYIPLDETELYSNTTEAEASLTNRLYAKRGDRVEEVLSWELWMRRYFDPDFGGAVSPGRRNAVTSALDLTPYTFLDRPRNYSPIVSVLRMSPIPGFGIEWRADYDTMRSKRITNSTISADARRGVYFISVGHSIVRSIRIPGIDGADTLLTPAANELRTMFGIGDDNRRGWNAAFSGIYDFRTAQMIHATTQVTYNTDCCGFSVQYRRLGFRNENQFRMAFTVANIGSFGTLKKQERLF